ncbi:MAG: amidase family protein, partial [Paracoccaceae bacterium]
LGHHVAPACPKADIQGMMRAWTKIVACGTALGIQSIVAARGRPLEKGEVEPLSLSAMRYAESISGADYLQAVGKIHSFGRQMAAFFTDWDILLTPTLAEPPALVGRFNHATDDYVNYRIGPGMIFDYSPFCAAFNASGQPAVSLPLAQSAKGLPIGIHLAAAFGRDEILLSLARQLELAEPWAERRPPFPTFQN